MESNDFKDEKPQSKKRSKFTKIFIPTIIIVVTLAIFLYFRVIDDPSKSQVDGVTDEVYEQLVEWYFFTKISIDKLLSGEDGYDIEAATTWYVDLDLYKEAEKYAAEHDGFHPLDFFPNRLIFEHNRQPDQFSEKEKQYIIKMVNFVFSLQRMDIEEHERIKDELKEELHIKDTYNPFD